MLIYGTKIIPLLKIKTATIKTTISACTSFKSFIVAPLVWPSLIGGPIPLQPSVSIYEMQEEGSQKLREIKEGWAVLGYSESLIDEVIVALQHSARPAQYLASNY